MKLCSVAELASIIMVDLVEYKCHGLQRHVDTLFFSPPPEKTSTTIDSNVDESNSEILTGFELDQEPPTPAGFVFIDNDEEVQPLVSHVRAL